MERITFEEVWQQLASYGAPLWCGVISAIIVFIIEIILCSKKIIFSDAKFKKKVQKAIEQGNVVTGKLYKSRYRDREPDNKTANRMYVASYKYLVNDIEYRYRLISTSSKPPYTINLYYINNPKKAFSEADNKPSSLQALLYIIPLVVVITVMKLMGYSGT